MNYRNLPDVAVVQAGVTATGPSSIASLAAQHGGGRQVDILSIDVDGLDFNLLESLHAAPEVIHTAYIHTYIHACMHACYMHARMHALNLLASLHAAPEVRPATQTAEDAPKTFSHAHNRCAQP